jgi:heat shock protein HslJ
MDQKTVGDSRGRRCCATRGLVALILLVLPITAPLGNTMAWAAGELRESLRNMTYPSEWTRSGQAPLVGGVYKEPAAPDSAADIVIRLTDSVAVGTIGDQTMAAVVIVTDPGGSGVFFDLYLVRQRENRWSVVDRARLGDRIRVNTIEIEQGLVRLDLTAKGPGGGICCPTERRKVRYALQGERLVNITARAENTPSPIEGPIWTWQYAARVDGTRTTPTEPGLYTLRLGPDGQLKVRADCNQAGGHYRLDSASLTLSVTHSTMAACPPESLDRQFLVDIAAVMEWYVEENLLRLNLTGGGTMVFTAANR